MLISFTFFFHFAIHNFLSRVNPIQDGLFRGSSQMSGGRGKKAPFPKICHTYTAMIKLGTVTPYLTKEDLKNIFCYIKKYIIHNYKIHNSNLKFQQDTQFLILLIFLESLKIYYVIYYVTNKVLLHDSNYIADVVI